MLSASAAHVLVRPSNPKISSSTTLARSGKPETEMVAETMG